MAGVNYQVEFEGLKAVQAKIEQILSQGKTLSPVLADIGEMLLISHFQRWEQQVSPDGEKWQPLSPTYQARKKKLSNMILRLNDHLRDNLTYKVTDTELSFGTPSEYGAIHHFGGSPDMRPANAAIPARPWLGVTEDDQSEILSKLNDWLMDG